MCYYYWNVGELLLEYNEKYLITNGACMVCMVDAIIIMILFMPDIPEILCSSCNYYC